MEIKMVSLSSYRSRQKISWSLFIILLWVLTFQSYAMAEGKSFPDSPPWPRFGLDFQTAKGYQAASRRFFFYWGHQKIASQLATNNQHGVYVPDYSLVRICPVFSKGKFSPDYDYITSRHPEWLLRYLDGSLVTAGLPGFEGPRLDLGNAHYVDYAIGWLRQQAFTGEYPVRDLGLDNGMFFWGIPNSKYGGAPGTELYRDAWEYFLRRIGEAFRPQHKIILNVGITDLPTFARMIQWIDGVIIEDLCTPAHNTKFDPDKARQTILDHWEKGKWCVEHGKIWAVRYNSTIAGIKLEPFPGLPLVYVSISDHSLQVAGPGPKVLGRIDFSKPDGNTLAKVAQSLNRLNLFKATVVSPFPETSSQGAFQQLVFTKVESGSLTLKLKQAPREAFLFGYAAVLMAAGPHSYYILGDERRYEYYYPEMDWPLGAPKGQMEEPAANVFKRDFEKCQAFLNLSTEPYPLPDGRPLLPWRGALLPAGE